MKIRVINSILDFENLRVDWQQLYNQTKSSIFQSFHFTYLSWRYELNSTENSLSIVAVYDARLIAVFPFYVDKYKRLRFINDIHSDFCDFIQREKINYTDLYFFINKNIYFRSIRLVNVKKESNVFAFVNCLNNDYKIVRQSSEYSILNLEKGVFPYNVHHYRSHQKHRVNKAYRKYEEQSHYILSSANDSFPFDEIMVLSKDMISRGVRKEGFFDVQRLKFIRDLYNQDLIILSVIKSNNRFSVVNIILKEFDEYIFWIDLFNDEQMINIAGYINFLKSISLQDAVNINFARGRYFYKESNFAPIFFNLYSIYYFPSLFSKWRFIIFDDLRRLFKLIYKRFC